MPLRLPAVTLPDPHRTWAASGAMALTGRRDGPALLAPPGVVTGMTSLALALAELSAPRLDGPALLGERAAHTGATRQGDISCGGATRLLQASDGWLAVSLARADDREALVPWLGEPVDNEDPAAIAEIVSRHAVAPLIEQGAMLGLPVAAVRECERQLPLVSTPLPGSRPPSRPLDELVVVDLSALWAGPLCAQLLGASGARIIKVESERRPDGARQGPSGFFDLLHAGHESVALDFGSANGRSALRRLISAADVVIESSRPRALQQLGAGPDDLSPSSRPVVWVSITGHGREGGNANRVAFGDDAAVAGGLVVWDGYGPCFCADAVADPATGLFAAVAALSALHSTEEARWLLDLRLCGVAAFLKGPAQGEAAVEDPPPIVDVAGPRSRPAAGAAAQLGRDTDSVLRELG